MAHFYLFHHKKSTNGGPKEYLSSFCERGQILYPKSHWKQKLPLK